MSETGRERETESSIAVTISQAEARTMQVAESKVVIEVVRIMTEISTQRTRE